jgi:serine/threonine protein phosphatase PrpC
MCGWRQFMEDAHICEPTIDNDQNISIFAIFDGHGGIYFIMKDHKWLNSLRSILSTVFWETDIS